MPNCAANTITSRIVMAHSALRLMVPGSELASPVRERLDALRERTGAESITVIRRALAFYDTVLALGGGRDVRLVVKDESGNEESLLIPRNVI